MLFGTLIGLFALCFVGKAEVRDLSAVSVKAADVRKMCFCSYKMSTKIRLIPEFTLKIA